MLRHRALLSLALLALLALFALPASVSGARRPAGLTRLPGGLSLRVPAGWDLVRGWKSDVTDPAPRLALGSFPVRLSRRTCECGMPNVRGFPRNGAFVFVWEYLPMSRRGLRIYPHRPARFRIGPGSLSSGPHGDIDTCFGPSGVFLFQDHRRGFQVELYVGRKASAATRARLAAALDSLVVKPRG